MKNVRAKALRRLAAKAQASVGEGDVGYICSLECGARETSKGQAVFGEGDGCRICSLGYGAREP